MKQNYYLAAFTFLLFFLIKNEAKSQDVHYSQFYNSPLNVNPGLTGIFNGDTRVIGSLRDQWRSVPVPYLTFSGSFDTRILPKKSEKYFYGVGAIFNYDQSGDGNLNITDLNLSGSYTYLINKQNLLTGGILLGVASEGFNPSGLTWSTQWTGETFDPNLGTGEIFTRSERYTYLETGVGANYRFQADSSRTRVNIGFGLFHLTQPNAEYLQIENTRLPMRTALNGMANIQVARSFDLQVHALAQFQDVYNEYVLGGLIKMYISQKKGNEFRMDLGASYRTSGFVIPTLAFNWREFYLGMSYDVNLSPFRDDFGLRRGGPEAHFRYIITKVKDIHERPCPVY